MGQNFVAADRDQVLLMPPALVDWLPEEHFVWTVLGAVEQMDLSAFYGAYRANGQGRAAYDPRMVAFCRTRMRRGCPLRVRSSAAVRWMWRLR
jgi:hypothetical protein